MNEEDFFTSIEEAHFEAISSQPDYERVYLSERDLALRNCWSSFQESATSIAQLYKGKILSFLNFGVFSRLFL